MHAIALAFLSPLLLLTVGPAQPDPAPIPVGITDLLLTCRPTVGYRHFDGDATDLGPGWSGHDPESGVYFSPEVDADGVSQVFMHCPWAAGPGVAYADYSLSLPRADAIRLGFEIGLRSGARLSDGVTYRVYANGEPVFDEHCISREFHSRQADLSRFAGKDITLRLEVDPGPERSTSDDWSLWRRVEILAGTDEELARARREAEAVAARERAATIARGRELADLPLGGLTSHHNDSICPSVAAPTHLSARAEGDVFVLQCAGEDEVIQYRFDASQGLLAGLTVTIDGEPLDPSPFTGGPSVDLDDTGFGPQSRGLETELVSAALEGLVVRCEYRYVNTETGSSARLSARLWPEGKSLGLEVEGEPGRFRGFSARANGGTLVPAAFQAGGQALWHREGVYICTAVDLMHSAASGVGIGDHTVYSPLTDGTRNAMQDRFYMTVSSRYEEVLPNIANAPSPYLDELAHRTVLDGWGGNFADNERWLKDMSRYGVDGFLMIKHVWQRDGYDQTYPNTMPANANMGGDAALRSLSLTAQALGHRFNVHENYYDYYPNAEDFTEADRCLTPQGKPIDGWDNGKVRAVILKPSKLMDYVFRFTPEIKRRYDCDSAYHDIMPTWHVDYDAAVPGAGKIAYTHEQTRRLCDYDREIFGGPVVFEAADPLLAGVYDGGCNHGVDTYRTPAAVAAELLKVHPLMSNHGFGYYERWLPWGYGPGWNDYVMTDRELDKYRAYQTAFGRTGFIGQQLMKNPHAVVREFYLTQALGRAYTGRLLQRLRYEVDGQWVDAGTAARLGELTRINAEYEEGQQVYVNLADTPWQIAGHELLRDGTLTLGPRSEAWTAVRDGQICDFSHYDGVTYADARSHYWMVPEPQAPIRPQARFRALEGGRFELTVDWQVGRELDRDYITFWHFVSDGLILFQSDHALKTPTSGWKVGQTITDGPLAIGVPEDDVTEYEVRVGLYDANGRASLVAGADQVTVGKLLVTREGVAATEIQFTPAAADPAPGADPATYREGANLDRRVLDFGAVATNGAVVLRTTEEGYTLVPVPLGEQLTVGLAGDVRSVEAVDADGAALPTPELTRRDGKAWFETSAEAAQYRIAR